MRLIAMQAYETSRHEPRVAYAVDDFPLPLDIEFLPKLVLAKVAGIEGSLRDELRTHDRTPLDRAAVRWDIVEAGYSTSLLAVLVLESRGYSPDRIERIRPLR